MRRQADETNPNKHHDLQADLGGFQRNSDKQNARIEHDKALMNVMTAVIKDDAELFKQFYG